MDKKLAISLLPFVNSEAYNALMAYTDSRIKQQQENLKNADEATFRKWQGALVELDKLKYLRETVNKESKQ